MNVTIRDVAKATGVSTATVSNVLNNTGKVGAATRRVVLSTVKRMGYVPDVHARHLASRDRRTLGIIISDIENPFFPEVVKGFETRARILGYDVILSDTNYDPRRTREAADRMMEHKVRGVAVMTSEISDLRFEGGLAAGISIAKLPMRPTAVIAVNDLTAVGVVKGLLSSGCRVPQDISVTGFDNTRLAEYSNPSITTVDVHRETLGQMAADALHDLSSSEEPQGREYQIGAELVLGESSGPVHC
jgi:DNA-binding LacI/PurR family transcriptional regulator